MKTSSFVLLGVLVVGIVLLGCTQGGSNGGYGASPSSNAYASPSPTAAPSLSPSDTAGLDQVGPQVDDLDNLTQDLSAGDVSPPPDEPSS